MDTVDMKDRLARLVGTRLANKLIIELLQSNSDLQRTLMRETPKAINSRMDLVRDELSEKRFEGVRDEALDCVKSLMASSAICSAINVSCVIAHSQSQPLSVFVAHVASHYEEELTTQRGAPADINVVLHEHGERISPIEEKDLEHAAKAHSSNN